MSNLHAFLEMARGKRYDGLHLQHEENCHLFGLKITKS